MADWARESLGHAFTRPSVLQEALTHTTYAHENPHSQANQRLEFLGDSVVGMVIAEHIFERYPDLPEGQLTKIRAAVVCEPALASRARSLGLGRHLRFGRGEAVSGRDRDSILADAFEAVTAALYLDGGWDASRAFVLRELAPLVVEARRGRSLSDFKTLLQEFIQRNHAEGPVYRLLEEEGPPHNRRFHVAVFHLGDSLGDGWGRSKKQAEQEAAHQALQVLKAD